MKHHFHQTWLYEINSRLFCLENGCRLEDLPSLIGETSPFSASDQIWMMGIWENSPGSGQIAKSHPGLQKEFENSLPGFTEKDIYGSPYSIYRYEVDPIVGGKSSLQSLRNKLNALGKDLIVDFVPNHVSLDSAYISEHPDCFLEREEADQNSFLHENGRRYAHGKDPYFDGWTDTIQWDFSQPKTIDLHKKILLSIAEQADGVRCDMAMLPLQDVFEKTHSRSGLPYWKELIEEVKKIFPSFKFYAEAYWNREYDLQCLGFDGTYDKTLYDRLHNSNQGSVIEHLLADADYQNKSVRFLENHDEPRASSVFAKHHKDDFAILSFLPGVILFFQDQNKGYLKKHPVQMIRRAAEETNLEIFSFYERVFQALKERPKNMDLSEPKTEMFGEGKVLVRLLEGETKKEILIWNEGNRTTEGRVILPMNEYWRKELNDLVSGHSFPQPLSEKNEKGIYFRLEPGQSQWFIF
ncbi:alpha-amylase family glycosyl hydrolase [Leptospira idonii]|uniref:Alpha-amylase n=1 Tax=Leptospira idonii TaxID=1193500 RepID=A0A4R9LWB1_9LEPT|nr:alpha-amylase family glycosyl hydrolase [Leptospira idonii]TGN17634.1 alpha-amylase [Leptospira idonii]